MVIKSSELIKVEIPNSQSKIIQENKGRLFCSLYSNKKGMFRKDVEKSHKLGKKVCDAVKKGMNNFGFFTSDELPGYGISEKELNIIKKETKSKEKDLIVIFAYNKKESQKTKEFLNSLLKKESANLF